MICLWKDLHGKWNSVILTLIQLFTELIPSLERICDPCLLYLNADWYGF
jgi:hypothetical protein